MNKLPNVVERTFLIELGESLHKLGTPAHRLEASLENMGRELKTQVQVFSTPTSLFFSFKNQIGSDDVQMLRVYPSPENLGKLCDVDEVADQVASGLLSPKKGLVQLRKHMQKPDPYGQVATSLAFGLTSTSISIILGGSSLDVFCSAIIGLIIGIISTRQLGPRFIDLFEALSAFLAAILAGILTHLIPGKSSLAIIILSSIIVLVPGLSLTVAMAEIATKNLSSGTSKLMSSFMDMLKLGSGVYFGLSLINYLGWTISHDQGFALVGSFQTVFVALVAISLTILFKINMKDLPIIMGICFLGFSVNRWSSAFLGSQFGSFLSAMSVGVASNLFARISKRPASLPLTPGLLLLVPGSIGYKGITLLFQRDFLNGIDHSFLTLTNSIAIVSGLLFGNLLINPKRNL
jgi:uncharacterized membrane protein YjjP (DUF1212 family)